MNAELNSYVRQSPGLNDPDLTVYVADVILRSVRQVAGCGPRVHHSMCIFHGSVMLP